MMDFSQTEERQLLSDTLERWVLQDYPLADRLTAGQSETGYDRKKLAALADLGVIGALFNEDAGGFGGAGFDLSVVFETLGKGLVVEPLLSSAVLAGGVLARAGGRQDLIDRLISGAVTAAFAHFENIGWGPGDIDTRADKTAEGWVLNGAKSVVRFGDTADVLVVSAKGDDGISLFLLKPDAKGLVIAPYQTIDGGRAAEITLNDVSVPPEALIGAPGEGEDILTHVLGRGIFCLCAEALGLMQAIRDLTIEYLRTRQQFGLPIGKFQALQHRMAEVLLEIEQAKSAVINAAGVVDEASVARERALSAAKYTIGRVGALVGEEAVQMHGGVGMTWEYPLGHFVKRLTMIDHELGDEDAHLARFIALGKVV